MQSLVVNLNIPADEYLRMYQGEVQDVLAYAVDGRRVRFPARILQRFVSREGVYGRFQIKFDKSGRFLKIARLD